MHLHLTLELLVSDKGPIRFLILKELGGVYQILSGKYPYKWMQHYVSAPKTWASYKDAKDFLERARMEMVDGFFRGAIIISTGGPF